MDENVVMRQLVRKHNLVFLELNETVLSCLETLTMSFAGVVTRSNASVEQDDRRRRSSRDRRAPRTDSEELWHLRAGHLAPEALRALVFNAQGVRIQGIRRTECVSCAQAHAESVISRRTSANRSSRPF